MKTIEEKAEEICARLTCHEVVTDEKEDLERHWAHDPRWKGVVRPYTAEEVLKLRGNLTLEYTFAKIGAKRLWYLNPETFFLHNSHMYDRAGRLWKNYWMINLPVKNRPEIGGYSQVLVAGSCNDFRIWEGGPFTLVCKPNIPISMSQFTIDWLRRMGR